MTRPAEKSFEQALEEFQPLSVREQRKFVKLARSVFDKHRNKAFEHRDRPAALELFSGESAQCSIDSIERAVGGQIYTVIELQGHHVERVGRLAHREDGAAMPHNEQSAGEAPAQLRHGDVALFTEFAEHPERFAEYNLEDGPSWEQSAER